MATVKNRNARRSVTLLEEAFTSLLASKPYEKITVSDITRKADLNRGTFYAHFNSVDDLMKQTMDDLTDKLSESFGPTLGDSFFQDPMPFLNMIGEFLTENLSLTKKLAASGRLEPFFSALFDRVTEYLHQRAQQSYPDGGSLALKTVDFVLGGLIDTYDAWVMGDYGSETIEQVNQDLAKLVTASGKALIDKQSAANAEKALATA